MRSVLLMMTALAVLASAGQARASACVQPGHRMTVYGRVETGRLVRDGDPDRNAIRYFYIAFAPPLHLCNGQTVGRAAYVDPRLPAPDAPGQAHDVTGDLEPGATGTAEAFSFVAD